MNTDSIEFFERKVRDDKRNRYYIDTMTLDEFLMLDELTYRDRILDRTDVDGTYPEDVRGDASFTLKYMPETDSGQEKQESPQVRRVREMIRDAKERLHSEIGKEIL